MAAIIVPTDSAHTWVSPEACPAIMMPAVISIESPGRNSPMITAHSMKTKTNTSVQMSAGPAEVSGSKLPTARGNGADDTGSEGGLVRRGGQIGVRLGSPVPVQQSLRHGDDAGQNRNQDDEQEDRLDVVADEGDIAEEVAEHC